jgi:hypothetical protein
MVFGGRYSILELTSYVSSIKLMLSYGATASNFQELYSMLLYKVSSYYVNIKQNALEAYKDSMPLKLFKYGFSRFAYVLFGYRPSTHTVFR